MAIVESVVVQVDSDQAVAGLRKVDGALKGWKQSAIEAETNTNSLGKAVSGLAGRVVGLAALARMGAGIAEGLIKSRTEGQNLKDTFTTISIEAGKNVPIIGQGGDESPGGSIFTDI